MFHFEISRLNAEAPENIPTVLSTRDRSHLSIDELKLLASRNIQSILVTLDVSQYEILPLKDAHPANPIMRPDEAFTPDMSVTPETSQIDIE